MAKFSASCTFQPFMLQFSIRTILCIFFFAYMLPKQATRCIFFCFTTTPPHSATPLTSMYATRPIIVITFIELLVAILTKLFRQIDIFPISQPNDFSILIANSLFERDNCLLKPLIFLCELFYFFRKL